MTDQTEEAPAAAIPERSPIQDLFASAVHRFGAVWADLIVVSVLALAIATVPVVAVHQGGAGVSQTALIGRFAYGIAYFSVVGFVMLRGLPEPAPRRRVVWTYATAGITGIMASVVVQFVGLLAIVPLPLLMFAVPAMAAGDVEPDHHPLLGADRGRDVPDRVRLRVDLDVDPRRWRARSADRLALLGALLPRALRRSHGPRRRCARGPHDVAHGCKNGV